jgi:hypothetical protein
MNWVARLSEVTYEGCTMSIRIDRKIESKVKCLEANLLWISPSVGKFGEGATSNDGDMYDKEIYLSEHNLSKFDSSMNEISYF